MLFILFLQDRSLPKLLNTALNLLSNFTIYTQGILGRSLLGAFSSPVLLVLGTFLPNLVFRNFPGKSNLPRCITVHKLELEAWSGLPSRFFDEMFGVSVKLIT